MPPLKNLKNDRLEAFLALKLWALNELLKWHTLYGNTATKVTQSKESLLDCLVEPNKLQTQRAACAKLLDIGYRGWREKHPEVSGHVLEREDVSVRKWRNAVLARDGSCRRCGTTDALHAHHVASWKEYPELRVDISNGVTLCGPCHREHHSTPTGVRWTRA